MMLSSQVKFGVRNDNFFAKIKVLDFSGVVLYTEMQFSSGFHYYCDFRQIALLLIHELQF